PRRRMTHRNDPPAKFRRPTRPVSLRMEVELWERLEHHAPLERRSVTNLLQKLLADGLDRLDAAERAREGRPPPKRRRQLGRSPASPRAGRDAFAGPRR